MFFYFGDVVGDVVDDVHVQLFGGFVEGFCKRLATEEGHGLSVDPGVVGGARHGG